MPFTIYRERENDRLIVLGRAAIELELEKPRAMAVAAPIPERDIKRCELCNVAFHADRADSLCLNCRAGMDLAAVTVPKPPDEVKRPRGRPKMPEEKKLGRETGVKKISQEPAGKQGPIGDAERPAEQPDTEVNIGGKEDSDAE